MAMTSVDRPRRAEWSGPPIDACVSRVRHELGQVLVRWRLADDVIDDVVMVATELLANVVDHARTPFRVVAELQVQLLSLAVTDHAAGHAPATTGATVSGHVNGLRVVNAVALRWGWQEHPTGKTVWAQVLT
jgi:Histidine kinase-like ATPase domain